MGRFSKLSKPAITRFSKERVRFPIFADTVVFTNCHINTIWLIVVVAKNKLLVVADIFGETSFQYLENKSLETP
jgi:hypothetical protein